jgi:hypothetical protein
MAQPQWVTLAGSLGTIAEGEFYQIPLETTVSDASTVYYSLIAGRFPQGIQVTDTGIIEGTPKSVEYIQGVPTEVSRDITSTFTIRAFTKKPDGVTTNRINDRTFNLTVSGQDVPQFVTPAGLLTTSFDAKQISFQIETSDTDTTDTVVVTLLSGTLPPGLTLSSSGLISGIITPGETTLYTFVLKISDGKDQDIRSFSIQVINQEDMSADTIEFTADSTVITADASPTRTPILLTPPGDLGKVRADNYFAFQFTSIDFDGDTVEYSISTGNGIGYDATGSLYDEDGIGFDKGDFSLPPGLLIDDETGWFYGYIPDQGATETTYRFSVQVYKANNITFISPPAFFTITIVGNIDTEVKWLTPANLGTIDNGAISEKYVQAINTGGKALQYKIPSGSDSKLPQGLELQETGIITGRVSFNTFALDSGTTTFDVTRDTRLDVPVTTFDLKFTFTVNAYSPQTQELGLKIQVITMSNGGSGYTTQPIITISSPPDSEVATPATAGLATIVDGVITSIAVGNPGRGYTTPPQITITGGGGTGAEATAKMSEIDQVNSVSVNRIFTITVTREYQSPYNALYIKAMPNDTDREKITDILQNQDLIPYNSLYRPDDPNFGISSNLSYAHAYGLTPTTYKKYVESLNLNHYRKNLTLGEIKTARALDANGNPKYEVVYANIVDNLVNNKGVSVSKSVKLPYSVTVDGSLTSAKNSWDAFDPNPEVKPLPLSKQTTAWFDAAKDLNMLTNIGSQMARQWADDLQPGDPAAPGGSKAGEPFNWKPENSCDIYKGEPERYARFKDQIAALGGENGNIIWSCYNLDGVVNCAPFAFLVEEGEYAYLVCRGTLNLNDSRLDALALPSANPIGGFGKGLVHSGFNRASLGLGMDPFTDRIFPNIRDVAQGISITQALNNTTKKKLRLGGHSLGGVMTVWTTMFAQYLDKFDVIESYPSAGPLPGNPNFGLWFNALEDKSGNKLGDSFQRLTNKYDGIPTVPGPKFGYANVGVHVQYEAEYLNDEGKPDVGENHQICCAYAYALQHPFDPYNNKNNGVDCVFPKPIPKPIPPLILTSADNLYNPNDHYDNLVAELTGGDFPEPRTSQIVSTVYPNSLFNMREQVITQVGQVSKQLPDWMTSTQEDGSVLGFTPAWILAYVEPGKADEIKYFLNQDTTLNLNQIDFEVDRYNLDLGQSFNWNTSKQEWIPSPPLVTTFDELDRPSQLLDRGEVTYATVLPYVDVQYKTLDYIAARGGLDGATTKAEINGSIIIFQRQEGFSDLTPDQGFTKFEVLYDGGSPTGYDNGSFDQSTILTDTQRLDTYRVSVADDNIVTLTQVKNITTYDYVLVTSGTRFNNTQLYIPPVPSEGLTRINWSLIPEEPTTATIFDGNSTVFSSPADTWTGTDIHDKYLVFPKTNILG